MVSRHNTGFNTNCVLVIALAAVLLASACVGTDVFGSDVININPFTVVEGQSEGVVIKDMRTIPTASAILPNQRTDFSFVIENVDDVKTAKNVSVELFNAPHFKKYAPEKANQLLCNRADKPCQSRNNQCTVANPCTLLPHEQKLISYDLISPTAEEIANIQTPLSLDFKVQYLFYGDTSLQVPVVTQDEILNQQRQGGTLDLEKPTVVGSGPVQVEIETLGLPYILAGSDGIFIFKIRNTGDGTLRNSVIDGEGFHAVFSEELFGEKTLLVDPESDEYKKSSSGAGVYTETSKNPDVDKWGCVGREHFNVGFHKRRGSTGDLLDYGGDVRCWNKVPDQNTKKEEAFIEILNKESIPLRFEVRSIADLDVPYKTFRLRAAVDYIYELRDSFEVTIRPIRA